LDRLAIVRPLCRLAGTVDAAFEPRAARISLSAANQCCSASPSREPLATHISYARARIRSDKSCFIFSPRAGSGFSWRAFRQRGTEMVARLNIGDRLFDSGLWHNCVNQRSCGDIRAAAVPRWRRGSIRGGDGRSRRRSRRPSLRFDSTNFFGAERVYPTDSPIAPFFRRH
jgi:hypothetical protein